MLNIGTHLSSAKGFLNMGRTATAIDANTFQFFTRNPRGSKAKKLDRSDLDALVAYSRDHDFAPVLAHAPYTLNACSTGERVREFAEEVMRDDLAVMALIPGGMYNFHPGNHLGQGAEAGIELIAGMLNRIIAPDQSTSILLETMSGKGTEVGRSFEELAAVIELVECHHCLGVCLDTCHVFSAGYDIVHDLDGVLAEFDRVIGLDRLKAIHLNDSMMPFSANKDRHAGVGEGLIGLPALEAVINHPLLRRLPFYLETPHDLDGHAAEIALMRSLFREE